eukprot:TRINITY_DN904_c0_g1_i2.p2 TRINITY_DN904_c0_g1~~TRINITY_DN904_c0_g1_i2.p2  ORF type:complete len:102 (-),score=10.54 TRINITY_DN904_c0_g1_i2:797-1102(-)
MARRCIARYALLAAAHILGYSFAQSVATTSEANALVSLYNEMGGAASSLSSTWETTLTPTSSPTTLEASVCSWYGITCIDASTGVCTVKVDGTGDTASICP